MKESEAYWVLSDLWSDANTQQREAISIAQDAIEFKDLHSSSMENKAKNEGYEITDTLEVGTQGFALGYCATAPQPFVVWQYRVGQAGYFWGHYTTDRLSAIQDLCRRAGEEATTQKDYLRHSKEEFSATERKAENMNYLELVDFYMNAMHMSEDDAYRAADVEFGITDEGGGRAAIENMTYEERLIIEQGERAALEKMGEVIPDAKGYMYRHAPLSDEDIEIDDR